LVEITLVIGSDARCSDGFRGEVRCVVVEPVARTVTHLVVEPKGRVGLARLVPLDLVDATTGEIRLRCTEAEFKSLGPAEETLAEFVTGYPVPVQLLPDGWRDAGGPVLDGSTPGPLRTPEKVTSDIVPPGEVEERRGDHVHATDGDIGQVHALRIDPRNRQVTHVLLEEGHLWAHKEVAIPFDKVAGFEDGIRLNITKQQVRDLPPVDIDHPNG
jgi:sporulation protein YlmC with PRC-barrel domain